MHGLGEDWKSTKCTLLGILIGGYYRDPFHYFQLKANNFGAESSQPGQLMKLAAAEIHALGRIKLTLNPNPEET